jgi:hypothetical protein
MLPMESESLWIASLPSSLHLISAIELTVAVILFGGDVEESRTTDIYNGRYLVAHV